MFVQGKLVEGSRDREVRAAKDNGCFIVSPHWITAVSLPSHSLCQHMHTSHALSIPS